MSDTIKAKIQILENHQNSFDPPTNKVTSTYTNFVNSFNRTQILNYEMI